MNNFNKHKTTFYVVFMNIPYTDEEWTRANEHRQKWRERCSEYVALNPEKWQPLKFRPCHSSKPGGPVHTLEQAKKVCEEAIVRGAQMVTIYVYPDNDNKTTWSLRKGRDWTKTVG